MRRRWLLSTTICAMTLLGIRGWAARPAKAASITHVVQFAEGEFHADAGSAQDRYLRSQPHHWRQCILKN